VARGQRPALKDGTTRSTVEFTVPIAQPNYQFNGPLWG
jgi:hypothetical protein